MDICFSDCKEQCIHYWVCKNKEKYEQLVKEKLEVDIKQEVPEFVDTITNVSLMCKNQIQPKYNNNSPKYMKFQKCDDCVHKNICKNFDEYTQLCESLKEKKLPFTIGCPNHKIVRMETAEVYIK